MLRRRIQLKALGPHRAGDVEFTRRRVRADTHAIREETASFEVAAESRRAVGPAAHADSIAGITRVDSIDALTCVGTHFSVDTGRGTPRATGISAHTGGLTGPGLAKNAASIALTGVGESPDRIPFNLEFRIDPNTHGFAVVLGDDSQERIFPGTIDVEGSLG
jgi:hypothetical protein